MIRFLFYVEYSVEICRMEILFNVVKQKNDFNAQKEKHKRRQHTKQKNHSRGVFVGCGCWFLLLSGCRSILQLSRRHLMTNLSFDVTWWQIYPITSLPSLPGILHCDLCFCFPDFSSTQPYFIAQQTSASSWYHKLVCNFHFHNKTASNFNKNNKLAREHETIRSEVVKQVFLNQRKAMQRVKSFIGTILHFQLAWRTQRQEFLLTYCKQTPAEHATWLRIALLTIYLFPLLILVITWCFINLMHLKACTLMKSSGYLFNVSSMIPGSFH